MLYDSQARSHLGCAVRVHKARPLGKMLTQWVVTTREDTQRCRVDSTLTSLDCQQMSHALGPPTHMHLFTVNVTTGGSIISLTDFLKVRYFHNNNQCHCMVHLVNTMGRNQAENTSLRQDIDRVVPSLGWIGRVYFYRRI